MNLAQKNPRRCVIVLAAALGGCATTAATYTPLNRSPRALAPRSPEQVQVFSSATPEGPHVDLGLITVEEGEGTESPASLIATLRRIAASKGCDALVLSPPGSTTTPTGLVFFDRSYQVYSGTCVVYVSAEERDVAATLLAPEPASTVAVDPSEPRTPSLDQRRTCRDHVDFERNRNCIVPSAWR